MNDEGLPPGWRFKKHSVPPEGSNIDPDAIWTPINWQKVGDEKQEETTTDGDSDRSNSTSGDNDMSKRLDVNSVGILWRSHTTGCYAFIRVIDEEIVISLCYPEKRSALGIFYFYKYLRDEFLGDSVVFDQNMLEIRFPHPK